MKNQILKCIFIATFCLFTCLHTFFFNRIFLWPGACYYIDQAVLEFTAIFLPLCPERWD